MIQASLSRENKWKSANEEERALSFKRWLISTTQGLHLIGINMKVREWIFHKMKKNNKSEQTDTGMEADSLKRIKYKEAEDNDKLTLWTERVLLLYFCNRRALFPSSLHRYAKAPIHDAQRNVREMPQTVWSDRHGGCSSAKDTSGHVVRSLLMFCQIWTAAILPSCSSLGLFICLQSSDWWAEVTSLIWPLTNIPQFHPKGSVVALSCVLRSIVLLSDVSLDAFARTFQPVSQMSRALLIWKWQKKKQSPTVKSYKVVFKYWR